MRLPAAAQRQDVRLYNGAREFRASNPQHVARFCRWCIGHPDCPARRYNVTIALDTIDPPHEGGRQIKAVADIRAIKEALQFFRNKHGRFPTSDEGLGVLVPSQLERMPIDPWGNNYIYTLDDGTARISTYGSDEKLGGADSAADITSENADAVLRANRRILPSSVGMALVLGSVSLVPAIALLARGRPPWAVGMLGGGAFAIAVSAFVFSVLIAIGHQPNAWMPLLVGIFFACAAGGVLLRLRFVDSAVLIGTIALEVAVWMLSSMIAR